jgi:hypothetical protein
MTHWNGNPTSLGEGDGAASGESDVFGIDTYERGMPEGWS